MLNPSVPKPSVPNPSVPNPSVHIIGTGLIGTSLALALVNKGCTVTGEDLNPEHAQIARNIGLNIPEVASEPEVVFVCVPPAQAAEVIAQASRRFPGATISDVTSVKGSVIRAAIELGADTTRMVSAHPMAGREVSGPRSARADLFEDRSWVITPLRDTDGARLEQMRALVELLDGTLVEMAAEDHDRVVALVSHTPQILASLLAGQLVDRDPRELAISGAALTDMIRIAGSDPQLWQEILLANSGEVVQVIDSVLESLVDLRESIAQRDAARVEAVIRRGNIGKSHVPGKHGGVPVPFETLNVMITDKPGALAELFTAVGDLEVNLEDVRIEHVMGKPSGIVQLFVGQGQASVLEAGLVAKGFDTRGRE